MSNDIFRVKLITQKEASYSTSTAFDFLQSLMQKKFMYPTKPDESDLVIKGYCVGHLIYLKAHQNCSIYNNIDDFVRELKTTFDVESFELDFEDVEHSF